ncbi:MAG TPA: UDP-N-acetylmuramate dehydrogenase [Parachlamydiaceae bacterium]|nr:UDP-N-acetylmuramate dehydrogenase [Parachlamydiaceae bacterium]
MLSEISTFGIGGPAKYFIEADSKDLLSQAILESKKQNIPYLIVGKGSNTLFSSKGFNGLVIHNKIYFLKQLSPLSFEAGAGYSFSLLGTKTAQAELSGLEFASAIPASVGGAVFMNAGASGQETANSLTSVDFLHENGTIETFLRENLLFSYRTSPFQQKKGAILSAVFTLKSSSLARSTQLEMISKRRKTQPYQEMSAGCAFRNPEKNHASYLIDSLGLKGLSVGDAKVSDLHANFIINAQKATSEDVLELIQIIQEKVKEQTGIQLESEIKYIPYEPLA